MVGWAATHNLDTGFDTDVPRKRKEEIIPVHQIDAENGLFYRHTPPARDGGQTMVFFNALTGDTGMWEATIGESLRIEGHGTLSFNFRGQPESPFSCEVAIDAATIIADARSLIAALKPGRVVLCGLSIGGLFAAQAWRDGLAGAEVAGMVLINTLRKDGPRLQWIGDALVRCAGVGGLELFRDLLTPLLLNQDWLADNRVNFLRDSGYTPLAKDAGHYNLLAHAGTADWDFPWEALDTPVLVVTGLQDHVFLEADVVDELAQRLPQGQRLDMLDAGHILGHILPAERPAELSTALNDFLRGI